MRQVAHAVEASIDVVQVRERDLEAVEFAAFVDAALAITRGSRTRLVVNEGLDVALACGADGVHLRADSVPPEDARSIVPAGFIIGRSVHSPDEAARVGQAADYLIAGTVWATPAKPADWHLIGVSGLAAIVRAARVPVLAIGGVDADRIGQLKRAGAAGAAAIGLFIAPERRPAEAAGCRAVPLVQIAQTLRGRFAISN
jgi:thiamine-phosphate pyrophosphorylase